MNTDFILDYTILYRPVQNINLEILFLQIAVELYGRNSTTSSGKFFLFESSPKYGTTHDALLSVSLSFPQLLVSVVTEIFTAPGVIVVNLYLTAFLKAYIFSDPD